MANIIQSICEELTFNPTTFEISVKVGELSDTVTNGILIVKLANTVINQQNVDLSYPAKTITILLSEEHRDCKHKMCEAILKINNVRIAGIQQRFKICGI